MHISQLLISIEQANCELTVMRFSEPFMRPNIWDVVLRYTDGNGTKIETHKKGEVFVEALEAAWAAFSILAKNGLPAGALLAPIEPCGQSCQPSLPTFATCYDSR
jgi:hypothetical protein